MAPKKTTGPNAAALKKFEDRFTKTFGADSLQDESAQSDYLVIPTGSIDLDRALGVGGYVRGRLTEVWGVDDLGKTTLVLQGVREAQRVVPDRMVLWIDMEQKWDWAWARQHGVNTAKNRFRLYVPESAEDVADAIKEAVRSGLFSMIVLDSIGAMIPEAEKEKDADEAVMMIQAKIVTRMVKIAAVEARKSTTAVVLINQVRADTSMSRRTTTTGGGFALRHCTTHKIEMKRGGDTPLSIKDGAATQQVGHQIAAYIERNKVATAKKTALFTLVYTETDQYGPVGIDQVDEAARVGVAQGVIGKGGAWYTLPDGQRCNGLDKVKDALREDPDLVDRVRAMIISGERGALVEEEEFDPDAVDEDQEALEGTGLFRKGADEAKAAVSA